MCLILPLCGALAIMKNKKSLASFPLQIIVILSIYMRTLFDFEIEKNKKEQKQGKTK